MRSVTNSRREILSALERLMSGTAALSAEQYAGFLQAVAQAVEALASAPHGSDPVAAGMWHNHERMPALARLSDALSPDEGPSAVERLAEQRRGDREVVRALHQALLESAGA